ncbi:unnamed protein product [Protopolystoma xenopodis]|uniref:Uncharacterized protein n=1 Tax=Protopolystoma xenopodis TaxID=117903 RepID=A0A448XBF8_9PLAT|nr:unnamed protein product [Protopolystoma xenopodis]
MLNKLGFRFVVGALSSPLLKSQQPPVHLPPSGLLPCKDSVYQATYIYDEQVDIFDKASSFHFDRGHPVAAFTRLSHQRGRMGNALRRAAAQTTNRPKVVVLELEMHQF